MKLKNRSFLYGALTALLFVAAAPCIADDISEGFEDWTEQSTFGNYSHGAWEVNSAAIRGYPPPPPYFAARTGSKAAWLNRWSASTNSWAKVNLSTGAGTLSFWIKSAGGTQTLVVEKSADGATGWTTLTNLSYGSTSWGQIQYAVQEHGTFYLRIRKTGDSGETTAYLGIDDIVIDDPPSRVVISNLEHDPDPVYIGDAVDVEADFASLGPVSNLVATSFWQRAAGPWNAVPMTNTVGDTYRTAVSIPAQDQVGVPMQYYVTAWFDGFNPLSPVGSPTNTYQVRMRDFDSDYTSLSVTGDPATDMTLYADRAWQGVFQPAGNLTDAAFQFSGVHTNSATHTWGEAKTAPLPFPGSATPGGPSITMAGTYNNPILFKFDETTLDYSVREGVFQDFSGWTTGGFATETNDEWAVYNTLVGADTNREHVGNAAYLNSNGLAAVRSPWLPDGVGEISFWYRNYSSSGSPVAACVIQKSQTGGTNDAEWVTLDTITDIYGTEYGRYSLRLNDRHLRYIRILNSTNDAHAALCIDDLLIGFAGAGVAISNVTADPPAPTVFEPVSISADIAPRAGASSLEATLYWRSGSAGAFTAVGMAPDGGNTYTATNAIPAGSGDGHGGAGTVEYYVSCEFSGYESELGSPYTYPAGGSADPESYTIVPARVILSDVQQMPDPARVGGGVHIRADATPLAGASDVALATWYRRGMSGAFTKIGMPPSGPSNQYQTVTAIPGDAQPGETVQYYVQATFVGPSAASPTNFPAGGEANPTSFVFRAAELVSTYTNVRVTGVFDKELMLMQDHVWQGVATVAPFTDTAFHFEAQNGGTVNWGDSNPVYTDPALFGTAESGAAAISLLGDYDGHFVFRFNETNQQYSAQQTEYVNFDDWSSAVGDFGGSTNSEGWVIRGARTTTPSGDDLERTFGGSGRSCILSHTNTGLQFVQTPGMIDGDGEIGFWYRNWSDEENVQPAGFEIQKSANSLDWITVDTVTNILSPDYVHYSLTLSETSFYFIRIVNTTNTPRGRLCLDEVFVARPGPRLGFSNVKNTPSSPTMIDDVIIEADIASIRSASNIAATVWLRAGTDGVFEPIAMTNTSGTHFETVTTLPKGWAGTMQYYIEASFEGMYAGERVTSYYPPRADLNPVSYNNASVNNAETDFEEWAQQSSVGTYSNASGWVISQALIRGFPPPPPYFAAHGGAQAGWLNTGSPTNAWLRSPFLSNGAGLIAFWAKSAGGLNTFVLEVSLDGDTWTTLEEYTLPAAQGWTEYTYYLNDLTPQYARIRKLADDGNATAYLGLDDVTISFPPAEVRLENIHVTPIYPDATAAPQIQCDIVSVNPFLEAIGITAGVYYRVAGEPAFSGPAPMARNGQTFTTTDNIPAFAAGSLVEYYIQANFKGYSQQARESRSPSFYPEGVGGVSTNQYFLPPTSAPAAYYVRPQFMAGYQNFDLWTNATSPGHHALDNWEINDARTLALSQEVWHSTAWATELLHVDGNYADSYIQTPILSDGVGTLAFFARNATNATIELDVLMSTNGPLYETVATVTNTSHTSWTRHSIPLNIPVPTRLRIRKANETDAGQTVWIDDVEMAYIPSEVTIHDVVLHPGYPAAGAAVDVSCQITPQPNPVEQAGNISVALYYRNATQGGAFTGPVPMLPEGDVYSMLSPIPGSLNNSRDRIEYYIEASFTGYAYETENNGRSPTYYPEGPTGVDPDHYYAPPTDSPANYTVRQYASDYGNVRIDLSGLEVDMRQSGDNNWVGLLFVNETLASGELDLSGLSYYDGVRYETSTVQWGDSDQPRDRLPYVGTMGLYEDAIVISNMTRGAYVVRYDDQTLSYRLERGAFQDFDTWTASPNFFEANYSQVQIDESTVNFDTWALSVAQSFPDDFATWPITPTYDSGLSQEGMVGWMVSDGWILEDITVDPPNVTSLVCRLHPTPGLGAALTRGETVLQGVGNVTVNYRCIDDTFKPTLYSGSESWDGVMVSAESLQATALPTDSARSVMGVDAWMSVMARYVDEDNYYELRTEQIGLNRRRLRLIRRKDGVETIFYTRNETASIDSAQTLRLFVTTYDTDNVYLEAYQGDTLRRAQFDTDEPLLAPGKIGLAAHGVDLKVDRVVAGECALQTFNGWPSAPTGVPLLEKDNWKLVHASLIQADAWVELEKYNAPALSDEPHIRSPLLKHGLGRLRFRHWKTDGVDANLVVQYSADATNWTSVANVPIPQDESWQTYANNSLDVPQSNIYVRIINPTSTPNERVRLDDIRFEPSPTLAPTWAFDAAPSGWSNPYGVWSAGNGAYRGKAISDPLEIQIQTSPDQQFPDWTTHTTFSGLTNVPYATLSTAIETGDNRLVRVLHSGGGGSIVLNEVNLTTWRGDSRMGADGWRISDGWIVSDPLRAGRSLEMKMSRKRPGVAQFLLSPHMTNGLGTVSFRAITRDENEPVSFRLQTGPTTNEFDLNTIVTVTNNATEWDSPESYFGWTFNTNASLYVRVQNISANPDAALLLDSVEVTDFGEIDNYSWRAYNALITSGEQGRLRDTPWNVNGAYLNSNDVDQVHPAQAPLAGDKPHIQSGYIPDGIGEISFWYRSWDAQSQPTLHIKIAPTADTPAEQWKTIATLSDIDNVEYAFYEHAIYNTSNHFVRFYADTDADETGRICLDDILITAPFGAEVYIRNIRLDPEIPLASTPVYVLADITERFLNPSNIAMTAYYRTGASQWGNWKGNNPLAMEPVSSNGAATTYRSVDPIPELPVDTLVQYYVAATYDGLFSEVTAPREQREFTNPDWYDPVDHNNGVTHTNPYYYVFSCLPGEVWINEVNYYYSSFYDADYEFVEIAGLAQTDIANWKIVLVNTADTPYDSLTIPAPKVLPNATNGFGFFVFGDPGVPQVDATFTNPITQNLSQNGGVQLIRSMGAFEDLVCYGGSSAARNMTNFGYQWIGSKQTAFSTSSLFLEGSGSNVVDFTWSYRSQMGTEWRTPGGSNIDQTLVERNDLPVQVTLMITGHWFTDSKVWLELTSDHNDDVNPIPWYSTNLMDTNGWMQASGESHTFSQGVYTQQFNRLTNSPVYFYRVTGSN